MGGIKGRTVPKYRHAVFGLAACLVIASGVGCSHTAAPPAAAPTTSTAKSTPSTATRIAIASPPPETGALEKDWKSYGGTAYYGCPEQFALGKSVLDNIRPKIFDPKTGQY
jgi:hypothetical protein